LSKAAFGGARAPKAHSLHLLATSSDFASPEDPALLLVIDNIVVKPYVRSQALSGQSGDLKVKVPAVSGAQTAS
jgi:hypothetical protein